jgi:hypothetical protein
LTEEFIKNDIFQQNTSSELSGFESIKPESFLVKNEDPDSDFEIIDDENNFIIISSEEAKQSDVSIHEVKVGIDKS